MSNLYEASQQWSTRPDDERFWTLAEMLNATSHYRRSAREAFVSADSLKLLNDGEELYATGRTGVPAKLTNWSFGQMAGLVKAPSNYLRTLPAKLAADNINHALPKRAGNLNLLVHDNGRLILRSLTSEEYTRIWNCDVVQRLMVFGEYGWKVPPARPAHSGRTRIATQEDVLESSDFGLSVKVGDTIGPAGLYASDHDMFVFMINQKNRIADGSTGGLSRGFFCSNSEVGNKKALKIKCFLFRHVCGNHIVWNTSDVKEISVVHRGDADSRFSISLTDLNAFANQAASTDEFRIRQAKTCILGKNKEEVLNSLFRILRGDLPQTTIASGLDRAITEAETDRTIDPYTSWGYAQGLTLESQNTPFADERHRMDLTAGKVLQMTF